MTPPPGGSIRVATRAATFLTMTTLTAVTASGLTLACSRDEPSAAQRSEVGEGDGPRWVAEGATLLDVRTPGEFAGGHLPGALNIPVQELRTRVDEVPGARVVVYCQSGGRSAAAARMLRAAGKEVLDLGAMANWPADTAP